MKKIITLIVKPLNLVRLGINFALKVKIVKLLHFAMYLSSRK